MASSTSTPPEIQGISIDTLLRNLANTPATVEEVPPVVDLSHAFETMVENKSKTPYQISALTLLW